MAISVPIIITIVVVCVVVVAVPAVTVPLVLAEQRRPKWGCVDGACVKDAPNPLWSSADQCRCGGCDAGQCVPSPGQGVYPSVAACNADNAAACPNVKYTCSDQGCVQSTTGPWNSPDECRCWTCKGDTPGPQRQCVQTATPGEYKSFEECYADATKKCGWLYACP